MKLKSICALTMAAAVTLTLTACGSDDSGGDDSKETIKVGLIAPTSGNNVAFAKAYIEGWTLATEQVNAEGGLLGRKVELIQVDTDSTPAKTLAGAREAVQQKGAKFLGAIANSTENLAVNAQLGALGALSFNAVGKDDSLRGKNCSPNGFSVVQSNSMVLGTMTSQLKELPGKKWAILAMDHVSGHSGSEAFAKAAKAAGKEIVSEQYSPENATEFGTYISKIKDSGADAVYVYIVGAGAVAFINQASQFGLLDQLDTVFGQTLINDMMFPAVGEKIVGFYDLLGYNIDYDNDLNRKFVKDFKAKYGKDPFFSNADNYLAAQTLFEGIRAAKSADPDKVREALNDLSFDSIQGKVTMRAADHQLLRPSFAGRVVKKGDGFGWEVVAEAGADETTPQADPACKM